MAETNSAPVVDDDQLTTEEDLRKLKYPDEEVEATQVADETLADAETDEESEEVIEEDGQTIDQETEEEAEAEPSFVKEFDYIKGDTPEEYAKNLEAAYKNSTAEALRLKQEVDATKTAPATQPVETEQETVVKSPLELFAQQKLDDEIQQAYTAFQKEYPQVIDPADYTKFTNEVAMFSRIILDSQKRLAPPSELYAKAAISLGWEKKTAPLTDDEKLAIATKNGAGVSATATNPSKPKASTPQISEAQLKLNRKMYPGKTDQEIIDELTPYL